MRKYNIKSAVLSVLVLFGTALVSPMVSSSVVWAEETSVVISKAWARPVILQNRPGAAYFTIENVSDQEDQLIKATSSKAARVELHVHRHLDGVMKMEQVENIPVPARGVTEIKPGGYHLMLFGLTEKLAVGGELPLVLTFRHGGEVKVTAQIGTKAP